jgi:hypothetical protein
MNTCSICGHPYEGFGHNAQPVNDGRCCDTCNTHIVIARRLYDIYRNLGERRHPMKEDSK